MAQQLYLLDAACRGLREGHPRDAFLLVTAAREPGTDRARRPLRATPRVHVQALGRAAPHALRAIRGRRGSGKENDGGAHAGEYRALLAVSGYGAYTVLAPESGAHVFETAQDDKFSGCTRASVRVVSQPDEPAGRGVEALRRQAERALAEMEGRAAPASVVRATAKSPRRWRAASRAADARAGSNACSAETSTCSPEKFFPALTVSSKRAEPACKKIGGKGPLLGQFFIAFPATVGLICAGRGALCGIFEGASPHTPSRRPAPSSALPADTDAPEPSKSFPYCRR